MKKEQVLAIVRHASGFLGAYLVATGKIDENMIPEASGALMAITALIWSLYEKSSRK
jgi:hypothetical protein